VRLKESHEKRKKDHQWSRYIIPNGNSGSTKANLYPACMKASLLAQTWHQQIKDEIPVRWDQKSYAITILQHWKKSNNNQSERKW
jgi:hypothetical protein